MAATAVLTLVGCALGPDSRAVITRDGALGEPLPFVVALCGAAAMVCLVEPAPELTTTMPRRPWQTRAVRAGFVLAAGTSAVAVTNLVAPGLTAATARNALLALTVTFLVALWQPLLSGYPPAPTWRFPGSTARQLRTTPPAPGRYPRSRRAGRSPVPGPQSRLRPRSCGCSPHGRPDIPHCRGGGSARRPRHRSGNRLALTAARSTYCEVVGPPARHPDPR